MTTGLTKQKIQNAARTIRELEATDDFRAGAALVTADPDCLMVEVNTIHGEVTEHWLLPGGTCLLSVESGPSQYEGRIRLRMLLLFSDVASRDEFLSDMEKR